MYKQPSWYKNKTLDLAHTSDAALAEFRKELDRVHQANKATYETKERAIAGLIQQAIAVLGDSHPATKALRKALINLELPPLYIGELKKLERSVAQARQKTLRREQEKARRLAREAALEIRNAKRRAYYRRHKQLLIDLKDAAILECGDPAGPYQLEPSEVVA